MAFFDIIQIDKTWTQNELPIFLGTRKDNSKILIIAHKSRDTISEQELLQLKYEEFEEITKKPPYYSIQNHKYHLLVISPCEEQHIRKYSSIRYQSETYDQYLTHLNSGQLLSCDWIKLILSGKADTILKETDEFAITYNYKWNRKDVSELYLLLLFKNEKKYSLRELNLEESKRAKEFILQSIDELFNLKPENVILFFHYRPTFYQAHIHIVNFEKNFSPGMCTGRAILLDDVIENLKIDSDFYKKRKMFFLGV